MKDRFIDLHCHSALKPYSKSFKKGNRDGENENNIKSETSIWHQDQPTFFDKLFNVALGVTKFTQSDFRTSLHGGVRVLMVSIDPMERALVLNKKWKRPNFVGKLLKNFVMGIGSPRIKYLADLTNYYEDLLLSNRYMKALDGTEIEIDGKRLTYRLIDRYPNVGQLEDNTLYVVLTIEGGHVFNTGLTRDYVITEAVKAEVHKNIQHMKSDEWPVKPFYISLGHHFPNQLCGHAKSFTNLFSKLAYDQQSNKDVGISDLGIEVIDALLDTSNDKKRIYVDVKHMNLKSRYEYYALLKSDYAGKAIPIIVSHGALNFKNKPQDHDTEINFYNEEILEVARSGGIFGVQLDERRLPKKKPPIKARKVKEKPKKGLYKRTYNVWRQIESIALLLYADAQFTGNPWGVQAMGSDFDGIVDPMNGFWTHGNYKRLAKMLRIHARLFLKSKRAQMLPDHAQLDAETIIEKFLFKNAEEFMKKHLK